MNLRVYRTFQWVLDCARSEVRYGGDNPHRLVATDTLQQQLEDGEWVPVTVVEAEKPKRPETISERRYREAAEHGAELGRKLVETAYAKTRT